ncbi:hypothetical protein JXB37_01550 [candidate division WOR-3 bacterium]|nr:hypothetical protein [candidate division WOR-3 bacterium]
MRAGLAVGLVLLFGLGTPGCDDIFRTMLVTAQVVRTLGVPSSSASVLAGDLTLENVFTEDWLENPDPGDTSFWSLPLPARVTPVAGADVRLNGVQLGQKLPGIYGRAGLELEYRARYDLAMTTGDGRTVTAHGFLPDSFGIAGPNQGAILHPDSVRVTWTHSDSCKAFLVGVQPADSGSTAAGWAESFTDTTCAVPRAAFCDSLGQFQPGGYVLSVMAVNGGWNKSGLDLLLQGGNLKGALGTFGCAVLPLPVALVITE